MNGENRPTDLEKLLAKLQDENRWLNQQVLQYSASIGLLVEKHAKEIFELKKEIESLKK